MQQSSDAKTAVGQESPWGGPRFPATQGRAVQPTFYVIRLVFVVDREGP